MSQFELMISWRKIYLCKFPDSSTAPDMTLENIWGEGTKMYPFLPLFGEKLIKQMQAGSVKNSSTNFVYTYIRDTRLYPFLSGSFLLALSNCVTSVTVTQISVTWVCLNTVYFHGIYPLKVQYNLIYLGNFSVQWNEIAFNIDLMDVTMTKKNF